MIVRAQGQGYWNFVVGVIVLFFVFYVTTNGQLPKWLALLSFTPAPAPKVNSPTGTVSGDAALQVLNPSTNPASAALAPLMPSTQNGLFPMIGNIGSWVKSLGTMFGGTKP